MKNTISNSRFRVGQIASGLFLFALIATAPTDFLRAAQVMENLRALGYPDYLPFIIGPAKLLAFLALAVPGTVVLREWAVSGLVILFTGAFVSHTIVQGVAHAVAPLIFLVPLLVGYFTTKVRITRYASTVE